MRFLLAFLMLVAIPAWAKDIQASYAIEDGETLTIKYRDAKHVRLEVAKDSFVLVRDDKVWMVNRDGKKWTAMDMSQIGDMMKGFGMSGMPGAGKSDTAGQGEVSFKRTGRTETVAGYEGRVYEVSEGKGKTREVVLTDHEDVKAASKAFLAMSGTMASNMGLGGFNPEQVMEAVEGQAETGLLRHEGHMRLTGISKASLPDSAFELPPGTQVQSMPAMPKNIPGMPEGFSFPQ